MVLVLALTLLALDRCLQPSHFERGEAVIDQFYVAYEVENIPKEEIARAIREYEASISSGEGEPKAYERLVWIYCLTGDRKSAADWMNRANGKVPAPVMADIERTIRTYDETKS